MARAVGISLAPARATFYDIAPVIGAHRAGEAHGQVGRRLGLQVPKDNDFSACQRKGKRAWPRYFLDAALASMFRDAGSGVGKGQYRAAYEGQHPLGTCEAAPHQESDIRDLAAFLGKELRSARRAGAGEFADAIGATLGPRRGRYDKFVHSILILIGRRGIPDRQGVSVAVALLSGRVEISQPAYHIPHLIVVELQYSGSAQYLYALPEALLEEDQSQGRARLLSLLLTALSPEGGEGATQQATTFITTLFTDPLHVSDVTSAVVPLTEND